MSRLTKDCALVVSPGQESLGAGEAARLEIGGLGVSAYLPEWGPLSPAGFDADCAADEDCLPVTDHARQEDRGWVPILKALRVGISASKQEVRASLLPVRAEARAPEGGLSRLAVGARSQGKAHSTACLEALHFYDLLQP